MSNVKILQPLNPELVNGYPFFTPMQAFGRNQNSSQVSGFGFQVLGFADT
jgi:hypothetical protein